MEKIIIEGKGRDIHDLIKKTTLDMMELFWVFRHNPAKKKMVLTSQMIYHGIVGNAYNRMIVDTDNIKVSMPDTVEEAVMHMPISENLDKLETLLSTLKNINIKLEVNIEFDDKISSYVGKMLEITTERKGERYKIPLSEVSPNYIEVMKYIYVYDPQVGKKVRTEEGIKTYKPIMSFITTTDELNEALNRLKAIDNKMSIVIISANPEDNTLSIIQGNPEDLSEPYAQVPVDGTFKITPDRPLNLPIGREIKDIIKTLDNEDEIELQYYQTDISKMFSVAYARYTDPKKKTKATLYLVHAIDMSVNDEYVLGVQETEEIPSEEPSTLSESETDEVVIGDDEDEEDIDIDEDEEEDIETEAIDEL